MPESIVKFGFFLISFVFVFIHLNSSSAQSQLTYLPWLLLILISPFLFVKKKVYSPVLTFSVVTGVYLFFSAISYQLSGDFIPKGGKKWFDGHWVFLFPLSFLLLTAVSSWSFRVRYLSVMLIVSVFAGLVVVFTDMLSGASRGYSHGRPIPFGNFGLLSGLLCLVLSFDRNTFSFRSRAILIISFFLGVAISIWSQTRGGWIFLLLVIIVFMIYSLVKYRSYRKHVLFSFGLLFVFSIWIVSDDNIVSNRISSATSDVSEYFNGGNKNTSVGLRFELWTVALTAFKEGKLFGVGPSGFNEVKNTMLDNGLVGSGVSSLLHAHNDFLWVLATKGIVGFLSYMAIYIWLLSFYLRASRFASSRYLAISGILVVSGYAVFSLSDIFMSLKLGIGYFVILNSLLIYLISLSSFDADLISSRSKSFSFSRKNVSP